MVSNSWFILGETEFAAARVVGRTRFIRASSQKFLELVPRRIFPRILAAFGDKRAAGEIEILAKIPHGFLKYGLRSPVAALLRRPRIVTDTVQANAQIGRAPVAALAASRLPGQRPFPSAPVANSRRTHLLYLNVIRPFGQPHFEQCKDVNRFSPAPTQSIRLPVS
jgi:hypothetical protein